MTTGFKNNNPGNINYNGIQWQGATGKTITTSDGQKNIEFLNMAYGLRAMLVILNNYVKQGITNIHDVVIRWVGKDSMDVIKESEWISKNYFDGKPIEDDILNNKTETLVRLAKGIIRFEIGNDSNLITNQQWNDAIMFFNTGSDSHIKNQNNTENTTAIKLLPIGLIAAIIFLFTIKK